MNPDMLKDDGSVNPFWVMWANEKLQSLFQSAGPEMELNQAGIQLSEPEAQYHWVRVTAVDAGYDPPRHSVEEVYRDPDGSYGWSVRQGGLQLVAPAAWAVEVNGGAVAVGSVVHVTREGSGLWTFAGNAATDGTTTSTTTTTLSPCTGENTWAWDATNGWWSLTSTTCSEGCGTSAPPVCDPDCSSGTPTVRLPCTRTYNPVSRHPCVNPDDSGVMRKWQCQLDTVHSPNYRPNEGYCTPPFKRKCRQIEVTRIARENSYQYLIPAGQGTMCKGSLSHPYMASDCSWNEYDDAFLVNDDNYVEFCTLYDTEEECYAACHGSDLCGGECLYNDAGELISDGCGGGADCQCPGAPTTLTTPPPGECYIGRAACVAGTTTTTSTTTTLTTPPPRYYCVLSDVTAGCVPQTTANVCVAQADMHPSNVVCSGPYDTAALCRAGCNPSCDPKWYCVWSAGLSPYICEGSFCAQITPPNYPSCDIGYGEYGDGTYVCGGPFDSESGCAACSANVGTTTTTTTLAPGACSGTCTWTFVDFGGGFGEWQLTSSDCASGAGVACGCQDNVADTGSHGAIRMCPCADGGAAPSDPC